MPTLLVVHHSVSQHTEELIHAALDGTWETGIKGVTVRSRAALAATVTDALEADAFLLITPANFGYMSGALKHFFDQIYYQCRLDTVGSPYAAIVHGNNDTGGAVRAIETIATGLQWEAAARPVAVVGEPSDADVASCRELGATLAALIMPDDDTA